MRKVLFMAGAKRKVLVLDGVVHRRCTNPQCLEWKPESAFRADQGFCKPCYGEKQRVYAFKYNAKVQARVIEDRIGAIPELFSPRKHGIPRLKCTFCTNTCNIDELEAWVLIVGGYEYDLEGTYQMGLSPKQLYNCLVGADVCCDVCFYRSIERLGA